MLKNHITKQIILKKHCDKPINNRTILITLIDIVLANVYQIIIAWKESVHAFMHTCMKIEGASTSNTIGLGVSGW